MDNMSIDQSSVQATNPKRTGQSNNNTIVPPGTAGENKIAKNGGRFRSINANQNGN